MADLPQIPVPHAELAKYIAENPKTPMTDIMEPYRSFEAALRTVYAQDRQNPLLNDPHLNVLPLFTDDTKYITTRARDLEGESEEEKAKYVMPLPDDKRRPHGSPATVTDLTEFQKNFNVFSESSLVDMDWSNVVAAGSSVVNCLLPVPKEFNATKRKLREYYHEKFCPASDVDLFLYGLTHEQAIEKIQQIEKAIREALLNEVTVVRTKYAITIASQYPVRHVQIVLRVYKSVSEILTGFDIDAAGGAYDGKQVYVTPRALGSFITQINHIDLTRRSPSYENRLSKYSHRNFEVYWPDLDRSRVDPTIFERSFQRTLGLARLLVLERLPTTSARETYLNKRREERGRPTIQRNNQRILHGNIKDYHEDEIADWLSEEDISNYHTFTVPYGQKFNAKRIEKLCYTRDLLLNAEWNQPAERKVYLHRHPAFFGRVDDVIEDCCGSCPKPVTDEEIEVAEKEAEIYISGKVTFLIDDPGRQQIGSFNPLTESDWTDMAYVGNTARLCQSIVDADLDDVLNWLSQDGADPNQRDYTGRTPLHLAVMTSTPEVVRCLIEHGARLTARLADGKTALHLAASRGDVELIKILMEKSIENEQAEEDRQDRRRQAAKGDGTDKKTSEKKKAADSDETDDSSDESDGELVGGDPMDLDTDAVSMTTGSFVKIKKGDSQEKEDQVPEESEDEPDYYQIDVLAWDIPCSPLHLAIIEGNEDAVKALCDYGADSILPIKFLNKNNPSETAAILTLTLALALPREKAKSMAQLLLKLGATSSQGDSNGCTAFHRYVCDGRMDLIDELWEDDKTGVKTAINHMVFAGNPWNTTTISPLHSAIQQEDPILVLKLLNTGAKAQVDFETWLKAARISPNQSDKLGSLESNQRRYKEILEQPLICAIRSETPEIAIALLENGADPNALTSRSEQLIFNEYQRNWNKGESALDLVESFIKSLEKYTGEEQAKEPIKPFGIDEFLDKIPSGSYKRWVVSEDAQAEVKRYEKAVETHEETIKRISELKGVSEKLEAVKDMLNRVKALRDALISRGGKTFAEIHPNIKTQTSPYARPNESTSQPESKKPYSFDISFYGDSEMTETRRDGYIDLMEAAWTGDLDRIKLLCLQPWGPEDAQPPLKMAINDNLTNTPFSIAFMRGHHDIARAILEIVKVQYSPPSKDKLRFRMETNNNEDDDECYSEEEESDDSEDAEPRIVSEKVDNDFTIENIGQVSMQVKSHDRPLTVLCKNVPSFKMEGEEVVYHGSKRSIFQHVFENDDAKGLEALLDMAEHYAGQKLEGDDEEDSSGRFTFSQDDFRWAVEHGKTRLLSLVIKRTGAGIPLDHLVKKSGVEINKKPRYYQGLTVYGKKRKDWASAGRNMVVRTTGSKTPPLLHAAIGGNVQSVEYFLGDAPHRQYSEFSKSKAGREDSRLKHLKESPGGFDRAISKWLGADNDLVIHCAVLAEPGDDANELLEYVVEACPGAIEKKNTSGDTPLMVACRLGRTNFAKILLSANANQSVRNTAGENILHAAIACNPKAGQLRPLLDLLDADLRSHLFLQRKNLHENGTTPLHTWVTQACGTASDRYYSPWAGHWSPRITKPYQNAQDEIEMLKLLLEYSKGEELEMFNGAGETCLHTAIMHNMVSIVSVLTSFKPRLLYRENAVGRTPAEVAHDRLTAEKLAKPNAVRLDGKEKLGEFASKKPEEFAGKAQVKNRTPEQIQELIRSAGLSGAYDGEELVRILAAMGRGSRHHQSNGLDTRTRKRVIWDLCSTAMELNPDRRRLVSLNEANDVAKRLGEKYTASRYFSIQPRAEEDEPQEEKEEQEVNDFSVTELRNRLGRAWKSKDDEKKDDDEGEEPGLCENCGEYHER